MLNNKSNNEPTVVLGLDVGDSRIGVARAHSVARLPEPLAVIDVNKQDIIKELQILVEHTNASIFIIGLPKLVSGSDSDRTIKVRNFTKDLISAIPLPYVFIDESFSSLEADDYIKITKQRHQTNDALAACVILERYFETLGKTDV